MGMAASQARYLALVARKSNCEYEGQQINQARTVLSNQSANLFNQMLGLNVPVPPSTADYTKQQYSYSDGANDYVIENWEQLANPEEDYNYVVTRYTETNVYTGSEKKLNDPQVQFQSGTEASADQIETALRLVTETKKEYEEAKAATKAKQDEAAVLEMGISDFGEMTRLTEIAKPDYCVITNIGQCHLENLGSREGILKAKTEIFKSMNPDGYVFLNGEDDLLETVKKPWKNEIIRFGMSKKDAIYATDVVNKGLLGSEAVIHVADTQFPVKVPLPGIHMVLNALAATAVGWQLGLTTEQIAKGIAQVQAVAGRSHVIETPDYILIDDCYNANPVSMKAAIDLLGTALQRKVAILGDMFELGKDEAALHAQIGEYAMTHGVDVLICIGELSKHMYDRAVETSSGKEHGSREIYYFPTREEAMAQIPHILHTGDAVLIKASHSMKFEEIVEQSTGRI